MTPLVLPVLVVLRLGVTLNAYFYITWMVGAAFFMVSPSVAQAVFAEGVRAGSDLRSAVVKALRVIAVLLAPAMAVMIVGGRFILGLFGASYAAAGYGLLILLAISACRTRCPMLQWWSAESLGGWGTRQRSTSASS